MQKKLWMGLLLYASVSVAGDTETVGRYENGRVGQPVNQIITPAGKQIELPGMRAQGLVLSPDGRRLALSNVNGDVKLFKVALDGVITPWRVVALPQAKAPGRAARKSLFMWSST